MRAVTLILIGLLIGVLGTINVMRTLSERNPMPKAVMHMMDYHMSELDHALQAKRCEAVGVRQHLERLQSTSGDIVSVFGIPEQDFTHHSDELQGRLQQALRAAPADCAALALALKPINDACKSCHQQYRR